MAATGPVGFRPTAEDDELIRAHRRPDESTTDVLRRALRALDRERWEQQARADMERIAASNEDLSDEPDDWFLDEDGQPVDRRGFVADQRRSSTQSAAHPVPRMFGMFAAEVRGSGLARSSMPSRLYGAASPEWLPLAAVDVRRQLAEARRRWEAAAEPVAGSGAFLITAINECRISTAAEDLTRGAESLCAELEQDVVSAVQSEDRSAPVPPKLARLRTAAARRARKR
ncbi:hypothetical protein [Streptomyces collinus]